MPAPIAEDPLPRTAAERADANVHANRSAEAAPMERVGIDEDPVTYAQHFAKPTACERAARALLAKSADDAWAVLRACADKGNFTVLRDLATGAWAPELRSRPDAPQLLLRVIAARGGHVGRDLALLHSQKIPIFALADAARAPAQYAGQYVLVRARIEAAELRSPRPSVRLVEMQMGSELVGVEVAAAEEETFRGTGNIGTLPVSARAEKRKVRTVNRGFNVELESGLEALGQTEKADPFLSLGQVMLVLGRFGSVEEFRRTSDTGSERIPVLTVVDYVKPRALVSH